MACFCLAALAACALARSRAKGQRWRVARELRHLGGLVVMSAGAVACSRPAGLLWGRGGQRREGVRRGARPERAQAKRGARGGAGLARGGRGGHRSTGAWHIARRRGGRSFIRWC